MTTHPSTSATPQAIRTALSIYRVLAVVAGVALFVLILEMVMKYGLHETNVLTEYWSPIHGLIYMAYAASIVNLGFNSGWTMVRIVLNMLTGFVPFLPFVAERRVTRETESLLARGAGARSAPAAK